MRRLRRGEQQLKRVDGGPVPQKVARTPHLNQRPECVAVSSLHYMKNIENDTPMPDINTIQYAYC